MCDYSIFIVSYCSFKFPCAKDNSIPVFQILRTLLIVSIIASLTACGDGDRVIKSKGLQTDQQLLQKFIHIPKTADHVKFEITPSGTDEVFGPVDYRLYALLFYSDSDFEELTKAGVNGSVYPFEPPDWFKEEEWLRELYEGDEIRLEGIRQVDPESYFRSPYLHGEVIALDKMRALLIMFHTQ